MVYNRLYKVLKSSITELAIRINKKNMDEHYEYLTKLYLRLKGFIVSNLIIHSENRGESISELDIIGVRMPFNLQEDRMVNMEDELECSSERIEILIADVKNCRKLKNVKFNRGLRGNEEGIDKLLNWLGCFPKVDEKLIKECKEHLNLHRNKNLNGFSNFERDFNHGKYSFKFTFFCPSLVNWSGEGFKYISGNQMIDFVWECLNKKTNIETCSRSYDFTGWNELEKYVRFFKSAKSKVTKEDFEENFKGVLPLK